MWASVNFSLEKLRSAKPRLVISKFQWSQVHTSAYKCLYRKQLISSRSMFEVESCCTTRFTFLYDVLWYMRKVRGSLATALESLKFILDCLKIVGSPEGDRCWPARFAVVQLVKSMGTRPWWQGDKTGRWRRYCDWFERQGHTWYYLISTCSWNSERLPFA